jgi:raffinose/stachyose/melibiose transport system permease protein
MTEAAIARRRGRVRKFGTRFVQYSVLSIVVLLVFLPLVMLVFGALKTRGEFIYRPYDIPNPPQWDNIRRILAEPTFWQMLRNSTFAMVAATVGVVVVCSLAAFVFARMQFRAKGPAFNLFTLGLMFPINIAILPVYLVLRQMHLIDNLWGVVLVQTAFQLSGNILILRGFFTSVPSELQDAAYIDGCTATSFFWRILLPLSKPALAAVAALTMIVSWNDLLTPLIVINSEKFWTLPLGTMQFQGQYASDLSLISAFVALSAIPPLIFYLVAERQIVSGLTAGAVRG